MLLTLVREEHSEFINLDKLVLGTLDYIDVIPYNVQVTKTDNDTD